MARTLSSILLLLVTTSQAALDCPDGWTQFGDSCYKVMEEYRQTSKFDWMKALRLCLGFGGNLFSSENENEVAFVNSLISHVKNDGVWIGLSYLFQEGGYLWSDGTPFNSSLYYKWLYNMPLDIRSGIQCAEVSDTGWNLTTCCKENQHFICKKPKGPLPCSVGWFLNGLSCYKASDKLSTWNEAHQDCKTTQSYLVKTDDKKEQRFLALYMDIAGLQDENNPVWIDQKTNEKCTLVNTVDGETENQNCDRRRTYVCEKPVPGYFCYEHPSNTSFSGYTVNCAFPENLCFKYGHKAEQVTVQGCISAEQCKRNEMKHLECCKGDMCNKEISCYKCSSNTSFDDCIKNQKKVDCLIPVQYCTKRENKSTRKDGKAETTFHKECSTFDQCQQTNTRTVECCNESLCNTDSGIRCYDCVSGMNFEDCSKSQCTFSDSVCYHAWKQQGSIGARHFKYGCTKKDFCNQTDEDGYFRQCCSGMLCNKGQGQEHEPTKGDSSSPNITAYIAFGVGFSLVLFVSILIGFLWYRKVHHRQTKRAPSIRREITPLDKWEILPEQIEYEEELGRGAFGVVHKATLKRRAGIEVFYAGSRRRLDPKKASLVVAVKVLKDDTNETQKDSFMFEITQMKQLGFHQNIVSMVGCCTFHEPKFLVIEYLPFGDLLQWLRRGRRMINQHETHEENNTVQSYDDKEVLDGQEETGELFLETKEQGEGDETEDQKESAPFQPYRDVIVDMTLSSEKLPEVCEEPVDQDSLSVPTTSEGNSGATAMMLPTENHEEMDEEDSENFTTKQLFSFAWQIAKGMNHLAEKNFVHRDLAARNVLVGENNKVKISDFGLMREVYEDVYTSEKTKTLPVKWMAPESLYQSIFTIKSDVWSYGVLLWEMATLGGVPYPLLTNSELYKVLKTGCRMERPEMCCDEVHQLMTECWREDPSTRPTFSQLIEKLEVIMQMDVPYFDPSKYDETSPYYNVPVGVSADEEDTTL